MKLAKSLVIVASLLAAAGFWSCDRTEDSDSARGLIEEGAPSEQGSASTEALESGDGRAGEPERGDGGGPQTNVTLEALASDGGFERVGELPEQSLPPIPADAARFTGLYEKQGERIGLVLVRYPRAGFARPHVEDIAQRNRNGLPVAIASHGREVVEVRAASSEAASRTAAVLASQLGWSTP